VVLDRSRDRVCHRFPNVAWEYQHHFPTLEDLRHVKAIHKNVELPLLPFIGQQILCSLRSAPSSGLLDSASCSSTAMGNAIASRA
jgi:hypothetical protein